MLSHVRDEFDSTNADPIFDQELVDGEVLVGDEYAGDHGGVPLAGGDPDVDAEYELLLGGHDDDGEASGEHASGEVQCPECGKLFKNDKSMFGHLRSHPNRGYKGATPPMKMPKSLSNCNDASPASPSPVDDRPMARYSQRDPRLSAYEILAAHVMLTLRYRDNQATQQAPLSSPSCRRRRKHESADRAEAGKEESATSKAGADGDNAVLRDEHGSSVVEVPRKRGRNKSKEGREADRKDKDVPGTKEKRPYVCKHCKAEFPTHQALGGHMAAHNKDKRSQTKNEQETGEAYQGKIGQSQKGQEAECGEEHRCDGLSLSSRDLHAERFSKVFDKGWHSGQEPGGYTRQHFERKDDASPPLAASTADGQRRRPFDIDLNVEAPEQH